MSPQTIKLIAAAFSMKKEIKVIFIILTVVCLIPVFAVIMLTQVGLNIVSGALVTQNPQTTQVDIHDPATGQVIDQVNSLVVWPISGPVSLEFAKSDWPYQIFHTGIDIASPNHQIGDPVVAFMSGTVTYAGTTPLGFGTHIIIDHGYHVTSIYGHLNTMSVVVGQQVDVGSIIGTRGNTGWSTGPHLHFQINVFGIPVNPRIFLTGEP